MAHKYMTRNDFRLNGDPQAIGEALADLAESYGGRVTAKQLLSAAKAKRNPLHNEFEWDDSEAAEKYRLSQAGYVARAITVCVASETEDDGPETRAFVCITTSEKESGFENIYDVLSDESKRAQLFAQARNAIVSWRNQYKELQEFAGLFDAIDALVV